MLARLRDRARKIFRATSHGGHWVGGVRRHRGLRASRWLEPGRTRRGRPPARARHHPPRRRPAGAAPPAGLSAAPGEWGRCPSGARSNTRAVAHRGGASPGRGGRPGRHRHHRSPPTDRARVRPVAEHSAGEGRTQRPRPAVSSHWELCEARAARRAAAGARSLRWSQERVRTGLSRKPHPLCGLCRATPSSTPLRPVDAEVPTSNAGHGQHLLGADQPRPSSPGGPPRSSSISGAGLGRRGQAQMSCRIRPWMFLPSSMSW